jgi:hypothetical protein
MPMPDSVGPLRMARLTPLQQQTKTKSFNRLEND